MYKIVEMVLRSKKKSTQIFDYNYKFSRKSLSVTKNRIEIIIGYNISLNVNVILQKLYWDL